MKRKLYRLSISIMIEAKNEEEALKEFWEHIDEAENYDVKIEVDK